MSNRKVTLPPGSTKVVKLGYEQIQVPARRVAPSDDEKKVKISDLPKWARSAFPPPIVELNRIQSKIHHAAFETA